jgi:hypothetical protein
MVIAERSPQAWLFLADLYEEEGTPKALEEAKTFLRNYLQQRDSDSRTWRRLAMLCDRTSDQVGGSAALVAMCQSAHVPFTEVSNTANKLNALFRNAKLRLDSDEKRILVQQVADVMSGRISEAKADDYSRLAWLFFHLQDENRARSLTEEGLRLDGDNAHLTKLAEKLGLL